MTTGWTLPVLSIPSPSQNIWQIGPFPLRAYALCIIAGIIVGMVVASRRWRARGGTADSLETVVVVAIPCGIIGARIYHVITDYELYFGPGKHPIDALKIWNGGLGIWGAVALAVLGAWLVARRRGIRLLALLDAAAPGLLVAQAIGRLGNWFNQELFGRPTTLPWALEIAPEYRPAGYVQFATFHPTFLYELVWNLLAALALVLLDRKFRLGHGKVFALYIVLYTAGRFWIEALRIDTVNEIGGFRLNNYTSLIGFVAGLVWFAWLVRNRPGREAVVERAAAVDDPGTDDSTAAGSAVGGSTAAAFAAGGPAADNASSNDSTSDNSTSNTADSTVDHRAVADLPESGDADTDGDLAAVVDLPGPGGDADTDGDLAAGADPVIGQKPPTS